MALDPLKFLPKSWKCDVIVERSGGKDERNNPRPVQTFAWRGVLVGARSTSDPLDFSDLVESRVLLYGPRQDGFEPQSTDTIIVPETARMSGRWSVRGRPAEWPLSGWELVLDRENATTDRPARRA